MSQLTVLQALSILQLQPGATQQHIRAAYKRLALELHPDKHQRHFKQHRQQHQQHAGSSVLPADSAAAFSLLSAAYELLSGSHHQPASSSSSSSSMWPSFEAAYASGSVFCDALLDEAVLAGLPPADIAALQQLCSAAAAGQLAEQLTQQPPSQADEQQWRQLYRRLTIKWQLQQQQQQQQVMSEAAGGVGLVELLSDLLFKPTGQVMVEVSEDGEDEQQACQSCLRGPQQDCLSSCSCTAVPAGCHDGCQVQQQLAGANSDSVDLAAIASISYLPQQAQQQQQRQLMQLSTCSEHPRQHCSVQQQMQQQSQQQQQQHWSNGRSKRQRHGLGFYWMWLRRLLLARAVLSVLTSKQRASYDASLLAVL